MKPSPVFLHTDLLTIVLSILPVKSLVRFKCVSKHWETLISDHSFVKLHLKRSQTRDTFLTLVTIEGSDCSAFPYPICHLFDNPSFTLFDDVNYHLKYKRNERIVGSCNGLILLVGEHFNCYSKDLSRSYWLSVWNPATRSNSESFGYIHEFGESLFQYFNFAFGCDNSSDTYKVMAFRYHLDELKTEVRVLSLGDNVWRNVECFTHVILPYNYVYLSETINWLANDKRKDIRVEHFVIISFDLRTEKFKKMDVPGGFNVVLSSEPKPVLGVLGGCLSFSYYEERDFVIWKMKEFGVEDSWTLFLKIRGQNLQINYDLRYRYRWEPLLLYDDTLILTDNHESQAILYNWTDDRVTETNIIASRTNSSLDWKGAKVYIESLVAIF